MVSWYVSLAFLNSDSTGAVETKADISVLEIRMGFCRYHSFDYDILYLVYCSNHSLAVSLLDTHHRDLNTDSAEHNSGKKPMRRIIKGLLWQSTL